MKKKLVVLLDSSHNNQTLASREKRQKVSRRCVKTHRKETKTSGIQPYVIEIMCLNLHEKEALEYLKDRGYSISRPELYRIKNEIKQSAPQRMNLIASSEFLEQHMERIDMLRTIQKEMWSNYNLEKNPSKKSDILMKIAELQKLLAQIYDSTRYVLQAAIQRKRKLTAEQ